MYSKEERKKILAASIGRWMESGEPEVSLEYMLPKVNGDMEILKEFLLDWQKEGKIEWLLPLDQSQPSKPVVRFSHYITKHVPWRK